MIVELLAHKREDGAIRSHLRDQIRCYWPFESDVITRLRNKFVHQNGHDPEHEVEKLIASQKLPWCVICVDAKQGADVVSYFDSEWLDADMKLGQWACAHIRTHIHAMDQNLCFRFKLPEERWRPRPISRQLGSLSSPKTRMNVNDPINTMTPTIPKESQPPDMMSPIMPSYPRPNQKEIGCAKARNRLKDEISAFIKDYIAEAGVSVRGMWGGCGGIALPHTIRGHDIAIEYDLADDQRSSKKSERIGIRIRENNFEPYVTIWSRKALMVDFVASELNEEIKSYLRDVIDKVITQ